MSGERFTLDTNILVYCIHATAGARHEVAKTVLRRAGNADCRLTLQSVSEFFSAATRKGIMPRADAAAQARDWLELFPSLASTQTAIRSALALSVDGRASYWDALLVSTAAEGGCRAILTEDMRDGAVLGGVRIVNPFGPDGLSTAADRLLNAS